MKQDKNPIIPHMSLGHQSTNQLSNELFKNFQSNEIVTVMFDP